MQRLETLWHEAFRDERWLLRSPLSPEECASRLRQLLEGRHVRHLLATRGSPANVPGAAASPDWFPVVAPSPMRFQMAYVPWPPVLDGNVQDRSFSLRAKRGGFPVAMGRVEPVEEGAQIDVRLPGPDAGEGHFITAAFAFSAGWLLALASFAASIGNEIRWDLLVVCFVVVPLAWVLELWLLRGTRTGKRQLLELVCQALDAEVIVAPRSPCP